MPNIVQGSPEWHALRVGKVTASRVADVLSKIKTGESASRKNLRTELVVERLTGKKTEGFTNASMDWGVETEPLARAAYEVATGNLVDQVAFVDHPTIKWFGCSPDGLVGDDGLIEIKCPNSATHLDYLEADKPPNKYLTQMMAQMACTGRKWCDFVSFDPRLPDGLQLLIIRVNADDKYILAMENEVIEFLAEVEATVASLNKRMEKSNG
jgi:putative phage-type endonuclease